MTYLCLKVFLMWFFFPCWSWFFFNFLYIFALYTVYRHIFFYSIKTDITRLKMKIFLVKFFNVGMMGFRDSGPQKLLKCENKDRPKESWKQNWISFYLLYSLSSLFLVFFFSPFLCGIMWSWKNYRDAQAIDNLAIWSSKWTIQL